MWRGSRVYSSFVIGSTMLQIRLRVGTAVNGSITAVTGSGMTSMSDALIGCQPRIDDPSNPLPSSNSDSLSSVMGMVKCCHVPRKSRNFRSTQADFFSFANLITSFGVMPVDLPYLLLLCSLPHPREMVTSAVQRTIRSRRYRVRRYECE